MPDEPPQPPLEYRNPADDRPPRTNSAAFILGLFGGTALIAVCGVSDALWHVNIGGPPPPRPNPFNLSVCIFGSIAIVAGVVGILVLKRQPRRFLLAGFLLAMAVTCIIEGICFSTVA